MIMSPIRRHFVVIPLLCIALICGCGKTTNRPKNDFLIRMGDQQITIGDFRETLEMAQSSYPRETLRNASATLELKWNVLNELIEELLLRMKAKDLNIQVSETELQNEIDMIRKDYPDDLFEKSFIENAIVFSSWKKRLSARMLMEKVIHQVIRTGITVSDEEITIYCQEHFPDKEKPFADDRDLILQRILHEKAETAYREWIRNVYGEYDQQFGIEWNMDEWRKQLKG